MKSDSTTPTSNAVTYTCNLKKGCNELLCRTVVLGSCSMGVLHLPRAGAASCAAENPRAARIGRTTPRWRQILHGWAKLVLTFLGCRPFPGGWWCWVLLCVGVAPPECRQARARKAPAVVGFLQMVRPALRDDRQPQIQHMHTR